jgi:hypothetical protein
MLEFLLIALVYAYVFSYSESQMNSLAASVEIPTPDQLITKDYGFNSQSVYSLTGAILLIISGCFLVFYGYGMFKALMFITGAYFLALVTVGVLNTLQAREITNFGTHKDLIYLSIVLLMAVLGGLLFLFLWKAGIFVLGGLFGFLISNSLLQIDVISNLFYQEVFRLLFIAAFALVVGIIALYIQKYLIIISSAFVGSFAVFIGIDYFVQSGFGQWFYRAIHVGDFQGLDGRGYALFAGFIALSLIGIGLQLSHAKRDGK